MSLPMSKTRCVTSPSLPRLPCTEPIVWFTCCSSLATPVPTWPICTVMWEENCCSSCRTEPIVSACASRASVRAVSISRWRSSTD